VTAPGSPSRSRQRLAALAVSVLASAGVITIAVLRIGPARIGHSLSGVRAGWLLAAFVLMALSLVARALSWQWVLRAASPQLHVSTAVVVRAAMIGVLMSSVFPGRLGEPARALVVARHTGDTARTLPVVLGTLVSQTVLNLIALTALAVVSFASIDVLRQGGSVLAVLAVPVVLLLAVVAAPSALRIAARAPSDRLRRAAGWARRQARAMRMGLRVFADARHATLAAAAQLSGWGLQLLACDAVLRALRIEAHTGWGAAATVLLAINVSAVVPVTPGNVGVFQGACLVVLAAYGVGAGPALAFGIVLQAVEIATAAALGVPALAAEGMGWHELRERATPISDR
jgi:phosphatidylinositol alpha-mannosyltransferase